MKKVLSVFGVLIFAIAVIMAMPNSTYAAAMISAKEYKAGDVVRIEGTIEPGADLFIGVSSQTTFAPKDTNGLHEIKNLKKAGKKHGFSKDTRIPVLYYMLTNNTDEFGKKVKMKFGGPSFMTGIYSTTMFKLKKFDKIDPQTRSMLGTLNDEAKWNFFKYAHEKKFGITQLLKNGQQGAK